MEDDKLLLDGIISDYYKSIKEMFLYRMRNKWKYTIILILFACSILFFFINVIPIMPFILNENYIVIFLKLIKQSPNFAIANCTFLLKWIIDFIISLIIFGIACLLFRYYDIQFNKKSLGQDNLAFYYVFSLKSDLKNYLLNKREVYLNKDVHLFKKVIDSMITFNIEDQYSLTIEELKKQVNKQFYWIKFTPETINMIDSISTINNKIIKRIILKKEIDKIIPPIDILVLYEFSIIKPEIFNSEEVSLEERQLNYLKKFVKELDNIDPIESFTVKSDKKGIKIKSMIKKIFYTSNLLLSIVIWLMLLLIILKAISIVFYLKLNSGQLLVTAFSGAIVISATIYNKIKK